VSKPVRQSLISMGLIPTLGCALCAVLVASCGDKPEKRVKNDSAATSVSLPQPSTEADAKATVVDNKNSDADGLDEDLGSEPESGAPTDTVSAAPVEPPVADEPPAEAAPPSVSLDAKFSTTLPGSATCAADLTNHPQQPPANLPSKTGDDNANTLEGTAEADALWGKGGADVLSGKGGNDWLFGGGGGDEIGGGAGADIIIGGSGSDIIGGGTENDFVLGNEGSDIIRGGAGDDCLMGNEGPDILIGGSGSDVLRGGDGDDTLHPHSDTEGGNCTDGTTTSCTQTWLFGDNPKNLAAAGADKYVIGDSNGRVVIAPDTVGDNTLECKMAAKPAVKTEGSHIFILGQNTLVKIVDGAKAGATKIRMINCN
jgi:hypothetical protein